MGILKGYSAASVGYTIAEMSFSVISSYLRFRVKKWLKDLRVSSAHRNGQGTASQQDIVKRKYFLGDNSGEVVFCDILEAI